MRKVTPSCWHWLNGFGGLLTACLLLLSAAQAAESTHRSWSRTYLSTDTPPGPASTDFDRIGGYQGSPALVSTQPVFAFGPSFLSTDYTASFFHLFRLPPVVLRQWVRSYTIYFRQRLLDHQIAINAP